MKHFTNRVDSNSHKLLLWSVLSGLITLAFYWLTAYRSLAWWDNAEYAHAAVSLGNPHAPGSLLLTLVGHIATNVSPLQADITTLNLLAGLIGGAVVALLLYTSLHLFRYANKESAAEHKASYVYLLFLAASAGTVISGLVETLWIYATKFTPYILTPLFTLLILLSLFQWYKKRNSSESLRWIILLGFLIGLDFSVHRTNAILLPGIAALILIGYPRAYMQLRTYIGSAFGLIAGLSLHPVIMYIARNNPSLNANQADTWSSFVDYVSLKQAGGGFLMKFFPRKAAFWSEQVGDVVDSISASFLPTDGGFGLLGWIPILLVLFGMISLCRNNRRLGFAYASLIVVTFAMTVFYFNIPANFFRSLHRHYLPIHMMLAVLLIYGSVALMSYAIHFRSRLSIYGKGIVLLLLLVGITAQATRNFNRLDNSNNRFAHDFAYSVLIGLEQDAIVFTAGDNDTFPLWYLHFAEHLRPDVTIVNMPLSNTHWAMRQILLQDLNYPFPYSPDDLSELRFRKWSDSTIVLAVNGSPGDYALPETTIMPDSIYLNIDPTIEQGYLLVQDWVLLQTIIENKWKRPIYFLSSATGRNTRWLNDYLRFEGYVQRLLPIASPSVNPDILSQNLFERYRYTSYSDLSLEVDPISHSMGTALIYGYIELINSMSGEDSTANISNTCHELEKRLPIDHFKPNEAITNGLQVLCP